MPFPIFQCIHSTEIYLAAQSLVHSFAAHGFAAHGFTAHAPSGCTYQILDFEHDCSLSSIHFYNYIIIDAYRFSC